MLLLNRNKCKPFMSLVRSWFMSLPHDISQSDNLIAPDLSYQTQTHENIENYLQSNVFSAFLRESKAKLFCMYTVKFYTVCTQHDKIQEVVGR